MIVNRIGDIGIVVSILIIFDIFKSLDYLVVFSLVPYFLNFSYKFFNFNINLLDLISIFLLLGVIGKSAQVGLHV